MSSKVFHAATAFGLLTILFTAVVVYWPGLDGPFLLDDKQNIVSVYVSDFSLDELIYAATHNDSGILGRPVSVLSLVFSGIVHGPESWGYKYHNLLIHLINGLLVFWLLLKLLPLMSDRLSKEAAVLVSGAAASLWLLHPLMISTVLYAVQRMAQLSALFTLAALLCYIFARTNIGRGGRNFLLPGFLGFPLATLLAVFSKENGALIPLYVLTLEGIVFRFRHEGRGEQRRLYAFLGLFVALPLLVGALYVATHLERLTDYSLRDFTMAERLMTQLHVVAFYLKLILLPRLSDMTLFHDDVEVIQRMGIATSGLLLSLALAVFLVFYLRRKAPIISFAIAWFLVSHLMESTFLGLELAFEHRNYLAAAGPFLALAYYLLQTPRLPQLKYLIVAVAAFFVFLTWSRVQVWKSAPLLYQIALWEHPESARANTEFAIQNFNDGNVDVALRYLQKVQVIDQKDYGAVLHEVVYSCGSGRELSVQLQEAEARAANYPVSPYALNGIGNLISLKTQGACTEVSFDDLLAVVRSSKAQDRSLNREYLGYLERLEGRILILQGEYVDGVRHITKGYEYARRPAILVELAGTMLNLGRLEDGRQLISYLDQINERTFGIETAKIRPLKERLAELEAGEAKQVEPGQRTGVK